MMKWIPVALALLLSACSSSPQKTYYQLPALGAPAVVSSSGASTRQLWLEHDLELEQLPTATDTASAATPATPGA